ncbi:MAG: hypothetical protein AAFQ94_26605 [Bacteroidota bacterium]
MIESRAINKKTKKAFGKISADKEPSGDSFQPTAYVPRFWQGLFNISRLLLFLVIILLIFWFTVGSDLYFNYQRSSFEKENIGAFFTENKQSLRQIYDFSSQRSQKLALLTVDKRDEKVQVRIEDENMPKTPRPAMVFQLADNRWKSEDYEKIVDGKLIYHRNSREKTIDKNWAYDFTIDPDRPTQPDVLAYLNVNQVDFLAVESSMKSIGLDFKVFPDSIMSEMKFQKFGNYKLMYSKADIDREEWREIAQYVYIKHIPKKWEED